MPEKAFSLTRKLDILDGNLVRSKYPLNSLFEFRSFHVPLDEFCIFNLNGVKERIGNENLT